MTNVNFDPYWEFDKTIHFRPKVSKSDFFRLTGYPFLDLIDRQLSKMLSDKTTELTGVMELSYGQKVLYYWRILDGQVTNGGFVQLYYNGFGQYVPTVIKGLVHIGDMETATLIQKAENIYIENKELMEEAREDDLFESDIYERLEAFSPLEDEYYKINKETRYKLEEYIRNHPNEFCIDEEGNEIDSKYTGKCKSFYSNGKLKEYFQLKDGIIQGEFTSYFENGKLKERMEYSTNGQPGIGSFYYRDLLVCPIVFIGKPTGEKEEYYENGNVKFRSTFGMENQLREESFDENGQQRKLECKNRETMEKIGEHKVWYDNGQLKESGNYLDKYTRAGPWLEYYYDGHVELDSEYKEGQLLIHRFYNEKGDLLLKDGNGLYIRHRHVHSWYSVGTEIEYKNYKINGSLKTFKNGLLDSSDEYKEGKKHGISRAYYTNGRVMREDEYKDGNLTSSKRFIKSDDPKGKVSFEYDTKDRWPVEEGSEVVYKYPVCVNEEHIKEKIKFPQILFQQQYLYQNIDATTALWLEVNEVGRVTHVKFRSSYLSNGAEFMEVAEEMEFTPAIKNGLPVKSCIYVVAKFEVE